MTPSTCVLISTFNRSPLLSRSLRRIAELSRPDEVLVVDDGGSDGCEGVCEAVRADTGLNVRYLYHHNPVDSMAAWARNVGLRNTDCELVISSEPEMYWQTDILAQFLAVHAERPDDMLNVGTVHHEHPDWNPPQVTTTENWQATWTAMYRRDWMLAIGGYDQQFPSPWGFDDVDMGTRLMASGHGQYNVMECEVLHLWHPHRGCDLGPNERYFLSKMSGEHCMEVVANQDREWGVLIPRP